MDDETQLLWNYYSEQRDQGRSFDAQRTSIGYFITSVAGVLILFSASQKFSYLAAPISLLIILLGAYGIYATRKLYERQELHYTRARECLRLLDIRIGRPLFQQIKEEARREHYKNFKLATEASSQIVWVYLHSLVLFSGGLSLTYCLLDH